LEYLRALQKLTTSIDSDSESNSNNDDGNDNEDEESITTRQKKKENKFTCLLCVRVSHLSTPAMTCFLGLYPLQPWLSNPRKVSLAKHYTSMHVPDITTFLSDAMCEPGQSWVVEHKYIIYLPTVPAKDIQSLDAKPEGASQQ
jgi:hypothetical protein